jgi:hypothetical protein
MRRLRECTTLVSFVALFCVFLARMTAQQATQGTQRRLQDDLTTQRAAAISQERRLADDRELRLLVGLRERESGRGPRFVKRRQARPTRRSCALSWTS